MKISKIGILAIKGQIGSKPAIVLSKMFCNIFMLIVWKWKKKLYMKCLNLLSYYISQQFIDFNMVMSKLVLSDEMYFPLFAPYFGNYISCTYHSVMGNTCIG